MPTKTSTCLEIRFGFSTPGIKIVGQKFILVSALLVLFTQVNFAKTAPINKHQSKRNVNIISKNGKYLTVRTTEVKGNNVDSPYSKLEVHSVGITGEVTIRGEKANRFIIMNRTGQVSLAKTEVPEAAFIDVYLPANIPYRSFRSKLYPSNYLAISMTGVVTSSTVKNSPDIQFAQFGVN